MKTIDTLVDDIYDLLDSPNLFISHEQAEEFGNTLAKKMVSRLSEERGRPSIRLSSLGTPCLRKLWYSINTPELGEKLSGPTRLKFLFGDIIEELVLFLARLSGHTVTDEQKEVSVDGVKGHIDGRVDGVLVDVKSASKYSYEKFKNGLRKDQDAFGYLSQLSSYGKAEGDTEGAFIAVAKELGNICVDKHVLDTNSVSERISNVRTAVALPEPPPRAFDDVPEGASGNKRLGVECSYCAFKDVCWPSIRTFIYSGNKPVHLTVVKREPKVPEVKKNQSEPFTPEPFEE